MSNEGHRIDPENWDAFRDELYKVVDACVSRLENARALPWKPKPSDMDVGLDEIKAPQNAGDVFHKISQEIMPFATGNTHPQFFGWVHGTGVPAAIGAEIFTATMNSNCGGRDHGAMEVERAVIDFCTGLAGMPDTASGILTSGTSQATILAFSCARKKLFGPDVLTKGIKDLPDVRVYMADGAHSCILKALEVLGHGARSLRKIERDENGRMRVDKLAEAVEEDRANGIQPLAVVGTAGSVNLGYFDPIDKIADYCEAEDIWLHCDAAFGFWTLLADAPWNGLAKGIGRANSIATDFHKWLSVL